MAYIPSSAEESQFLKDFDPTKYEKPAVAADTALFAVDGDALSVLLIRRGGWPYKGRWALPGGFINLDEDLITSAARELQEETGLESLYLEQVFVWGKPGRDPRQRVITVSYAGLADRSLMNAQAGDDAAQAEWFRFTDYHVKENNGVTEASFTLRGSETIQAAVAYPTGRMQEITAARNGGLAFDHAESIAFSYEYLRRRAQQGFLDLAFEDAAMKERAARALQLV